MPSFLKLPHEILLCFYHDLETVTDAVHFARSCRQLYSIWNRRQDRLQIVLWIITHAPIPTPSKNWMETAFGVKSVWRPTDADLPVNLTDDATRTFLTTVGFPAIKLNEIGWDSTHLTKEDGPLHEFDADELYGLRYPDDESPPTNFAFHFGSVDQWMVMVGGEDGDVVHYDPDGWDHADGYQGLVASSLRRLVVLLWMVVEVVERSGLFCTPSRSDENEAEEEGREAVLETLRWRMIEYDDCVEEGSKFWDGIFESLE